MKTAGDGKITSDGFIISNEMITKEEGLEALLNMLRTYCEDTGSNDFTDVLSGGRYAGDEGRPIDTAYWIDWLEAIERIKKRGQASL